MLTMRLISLHLHHHFNLGSMSFIPVPSTVQPLPTRDARKLRIQQELEKIPIKDGLYLPTNPTCEVTPSHPCSVMHTCLYVSRL